MCHRRGAIRFNATRKRFEIRLGDLDALSLPTTVDDLIQLRIKEFEPQELKVLQIAACIGARVSKSRINGVC